MGNHAFFTTLFIFFQNTENEAVYYRKSSNPNKKQPILKVSVFGISTENGAKTNRKRKFIFVLFIA